MDQEVFEAIQKGEYEGDCISPMKAKLLSERYGIIFPEKSNNVIRRNIGNDEWNRNIIEDFSSFEIIRKCVLFCLVGYRTKEDKKDNAGSLYQDLLKTSYDKLFLLDNLEHIWDTLVQWNMNARGAELMDKSTFTNSLLEMRPVIDKLNEYQLLDFCDGTTTQQISKILLKLYKNIKLSKLNQFVTISKTLHFFIPQLYIPIDRTYTVNYFSDYRGLDLPSNKEYDKQVAWAISFHRQLSQLYKNYKDEYDELSIKTKYPVTKLLDDTLIGFAMYRRYYCQQFNSQIISNL